MKDIIINRIKETIKPNDSQAITGQVLQDILIELVSDYYNEMPLLYDDLGDNSDGAVNQKAVTDSINAVIPSFSGFVDLIPELDATETIINKNGLVYYSSSYQCFVYYYENTYYKYWYSWPEYNIETSDYYHALPNKVFSLVNGTESIQYVYSNTTKKLVPLRPLEVTSELGDNSNIPVSQRKITELYKEGYSVQMALPRDGLIEYKPAQVIDYIPAGGSYKVPLGTTEDGAMLFSAMNIPAGSFVKHGLIPEETAVWFPLENFPTTVVPYNYVFSRDTRNQLRVNIDSVIVATPNGNWLTRGGDFTFTNSTKQSLLLRAERGSYSVVLALAETVNDVSLLEFDGEQIVGGAFYSYYSAWAAQNNLAITSGWTTNITPNHYMAVNITESTLATIVLSNFDKTRGCIIKLLLLNRSTSAKTLPRVFVIGTDTANITWLSSEAIKSNTVCLAEIFVAPILTGEKMPIVVGRTDYWSLV